MNKKMWGGRFKSAQDDIFWRFQSSIDYDKVLAGYDVSASIAHVKMLSKCKIIPAKAASPILKGLAAIQKDIKAGVFKIDKKAEDIHSAVYIALKNKIGPWADYMHTARSRNDQVVLDVRMYAKDKALLLAGLVTEFQSALLDASKKNIDIIIPGLTHTQHAVPVLLSHQLLAYVEMLERDKQRLIQAKERCDEMPLGACALAGTSFAIDRRYVAKLLGFSRISQNSIDAVSDRDFVLDILSAIAILFMHLSRFCEDMILFSTPEFGIIDISEAFCTGSSIMPQKKNPDALELIRATAAEAYANLNSVLVLMKSLPLSYNRDMQLDKKPLFDSVEKAENVLLILKGLSQTINVNKDNVLSGTKSDESLLALDIADYLVKKKLSFKQAHDITGKMVVFCLDKKMNFSSLPLTRLKGFSDKFDIDFFKILDMKKSVVNKRSIASTNPILVRQQIDRWIKRLKD
jgi:argininosuccinate lyase